MTDWNFRSLACFTSRRFHKWNMFRCPKSLCHWWNSAYIDADTCAWLSKCPSRIITNYKRSLEFWCLILRLQLHLIRFLDHTRRRVVWRLRIRNVIKCNRSLTNQFLQKITKTPIKICCSWRQNQYNLINIFLPFLDFFIAMVTEYTVILPDIIITLFTKVQILCLMKRFIISSHCIVPSMSLFYSLILGSKRVDGWSWVSHLHPVTIKCSLHTELTH